MPALQRGAPGTAQEDQQGLGWLQDVSPVCTSSEPHPDLPDPDLMIGHCGPREPRGSVDQRTEDAFQQEHCQHSRMP